ncbi:hypothetical protein [Hufsiella ginkgonis]|uniref:Uncharacterized protein n=1 Tax=Hufsiella ginkgonis TaxID=2695274 RepID=A0A7K1XW61_9SPHI|nr:hypothetical protein [Hufsiella ginkgonis]MXV15009.1 hypothetical protein [Hufsiella ginkgonis]
MFSTRRITFLFPAAVALLSFGACQQSKPVSENKEPAVAAKDLVSCTGIGEVKLTDSYQDLEKKFGKANLTEHDNNVLGKFTAIWDQKPEQVNIYWKEKAAPYTHIDFMETVSPDAPYTTQKGLKVGMLMVDVQKINSDMPLTFVNPYANQDPGLITSFNNGELAIADPCLSGHVEVTKTRNIDAKVLAAFTGEKSVESTHKLIMGGRMDVIFANFRLANK